MGWGCSEFPTNRALHDEDHFSPNGTMLTAIRPPEALVPYRNGTESFSSANPPIYSDGELPNPEHPDTGRENNHGFEGLSVSADGKTLHVLLQAATVQEGVSNPPGSLALSPRQPGIVIRSSTKLTHIRRAWRSRRSSTRASCRTTSATRRRPSTWPSTWWSCRRTWTRRPRRARTPR